MRKIKSLIGMVLIGLWGTGLAAPSSMPTPGMLGKTGNKFIDQFAAKSQENQHPHKVSKIGGTLDRSLKPKPVFRKKTNPSNDPK